MEDVVQAMHAKVLALVNQVQAEAERSPLSPLMLRSRIGELDRTANALIVAMATAERLERSRKD